MSAVWEGAGSAGAAGAGGISSAGVDTCLSGREAVSRCGSIAYDIIFLDHMMPGFDGVETLRKIREIRNGMYQDLPVIALPLMPSPSTRLRISPS